MKTFEYNRQSKDGKQRNVGWFHKPWNHSVRRYIKALLKEAEDDNMVLMNITRID